MEKTRASVTQVKTKLARKRDEPIHTERVPKREPPTRAGWLTPPSQDLGPNPVSVMGGLMSLFNNTDSKGNVGLFLDFESS